MPTAPPRSPHPILDHPIISQRYFFPRAETPEGALLEVDVGSAKLACIHEIVAADAPTVLFFHGNGEVVADYLPWFVKALAERGLNVLLAEYRGYGGSTGTPQLAAMLADVDRIISAAGLTDSHVVVFGRSVGSIYALQAAARHPGIAGLILESGIADVFERLLLRVHPEELGVTEEELRTAVAEHLDGQSKLRSYPGPLLVLHARHDSLVDATHGERLASWGKTDRTELRLLSEGDHNSVMMLNWSRYWEAIDGFLARLLRDG